MPPFRTVPFVLLPILTSALLGGEIAILEVSAGAQARRGTPVRWEPPAGFKLPGPFKLVQVEGAVEVPMQLDEGPPMALVWMVDGLEAGARRRYRLLEGAPASGVLVECRDVDGKHLLIRAGGKDILRYNHAVVKPPAGVEPIYERSGYIHPLWSPGGRLLTNDFPLNHKHHHGVWMPWSQSEFEGHPINFWEQNREEGRVECAGVDWKGSGPVFAGFRARHRFTDLKAAGGPKPVLDETWDVRAYAAGNAYLVDFVSAQKCSGSSPLKLIKHRYGGFGFRGAGEWEGKDGVEFLTSEGKTRVDGHATAAKWCEMHGKVSGAEAGVAFLCHPSNFRFPQNMRIHDTEPFFNFTPCQTGDFDITPEKPLLSRYRLFIHDGAAGAAEVERVWKDYADPPGVELVSGATAPATPLTGDQILALLGQRTGGEWRVDSAWVDGSKLKGRVIYEWGIAKKLIKTKTYVDGPQGEYLRYEAFSFWDAKRNSGRWISISFEGGVSEGSITGSGTRLDYSSDASTGSPKLRQSIDLKSEDAYEWHVELEREGEWKTMIRATFHRQPSEAASK